MEVARDPGGGAQRAAEGAKLQSRRAAQLLTSYSRAAENGGQSFLDKLVAGMPRRLEQCKANGYGRCGK